MIHLMKNEWKKVSIPVSLTIVMMSVIASILCCTIYKNYALQYDLEAWERGTNILNFIFPLVVVLPLCWNVYYERKNNFMLYVLPRIKQNKYLTSKWIVFAISAFLILFIPYFISAIVSLYIKEPIISYASPDPDVDVFQHVFIKTFISSPLIYATVLSIYRGLLGVLVMSFGYVLALYVDNIFAILTGPFIYVTLENFILSILGMPKYRLVTAFDPTVLSVGCITKGTFFVGPVLVTLVILLIWFYYKVIKKASICKV